MDSRSINFNVLRRHDSKITSIIDSTSYVVIYRYFHGAWSKTGLEGTMFIFERELQNDLPRYGVFVLNRQGLDNMSQALLSGWEVDLDEGLIIWRNEGATGDADDDIIHGLWIYEEQDRSRIASVMQSLINLSTPQSEPEPTTSSAQVSLSHPVPRIPIIPPGQSISLDQLFGVGSVCSEAPPPSTLDLPHPASSIADSTEPQTSLPPQHVMSPDPSDLPKGMQLLDSLFQTASLKTQVSNPSISTHDSSIPQQSIGIHHLLQTQPISPNPIQNHPNSGSSSSTHHHHHHQKNSSDENYKPQSYNDGNRNPTHKAHHHHRAPHSNSNSKTGQAQSSRHSSGGSSSHPRSEKMGTQHSNGPTAPTHYPVHQNSQYQATQAVLVSNESAHAEARHNILSLLGHPIATSAPNHNHNHNLITGQISNSGSWNGVNDGSPDSIRSSGGNRDVYQPSSYGRNLQTKYNQQEVNSNLRSQQTSQHSSPQQNHSPHSIPYTPSQPPQVPIQAEIGSPNSSGGGHHHLHHQHLSRNGSQFHQQQTSNHSQVKVRGTPPKPPLPNIPIQQTRPSQHSGVNHVWNVENDPKRALSPLNPASQTHSQRSQQPQATQQQQQQQQWNGVQQVRKTKAGEFHAPIVNDSSRPNRTNSFNQTPENKDREGKILVNKIVAEVLDEGLSNRESNQEENSKNRKNGTEDDDDDEALDKKEFVVGVLELIKNNGAFVDMLYARYLARYAERYL